MIVSRFETAVGWWKAGYKNQLFFYPITIESWTMKKACDCFEIFSFHYKFVIEELKSWFLYPAFHHPTAVSKLTIAFPSSPHNRHPVRWVGLREH